MQDGTKNKTVWVMHEAKRCCRWKKNFYEREEQNGGQQNYTSRNDFGWPTIAQTSKCLVLENIFFCLSYFIEQHKEQRKGSEQV